MTGGRKNTVHLYIHIQCTCTAEPSSNNRHIGTDNLSIIERLSSFRNEIGALKSGQFQGYIRTCTLRTCTCIPVFTGVVLVPEWDPECSHNTYHYRSL